MVTKCIQLMCDNCGYNKVYIGTNLKKVEKVARRHGWIITKDKNHYDTRGCYQTGKRIDRFCKEMEL